jgi:ribonuclease HI
MKTYELTVQWDGGCKPNPGEKYGSYRITYNGKPVLWHSLFSLGHGTNNEAEFEALEKALVALTEKIESKGRSPSEVKLNLLTDSMVVKHRLTPRAKPRKEKGETAKRMAGFATRIMDRLKVFSGYEIHWQPREHNVEAFGH